ncbi:MAG: GntR family transcriptional regulator [Acidimicrobiales bacterium]
MSSTVEHTDLGTAVTASLRSTIVSGELAAGSRLVETELAERFGVSRGPVRDALAELERSGLVELRARKGSFVRRLTASDVDEVYTLRIALESLAIRQAATVGVERSALQPLLDNLETANAGQDRAAIGNADMALHRAVVIAAGHGRLLDAWERLADQTLLLMTDLPAVNPEIQGPAGAHRAIVDHLSSGDAELAAAALVEHLESARSAMLERFND